MPIRLTKAVKFLLITCFATFIVQQTVDQFYGGNLTGWLGLVPYGFAVEHRFWQVFTYAFLHADVMHLFLNLMILAFIGSELEAAWGSARFLRFYFFCSVAAGVFYLLLQLLISNEASLHSPMVGASGGIYGLLMAYGLIFGERVMLFMMLFPMKAKHFIWVLAGVEFMSSVFSSRGGIASAAHLGGMVAGFVYLWGRATWLVAKRNRSQGKKPGKKRRKTSDHLKLIISNKPQESDSSDDDVDDNPKTWH